MKLWEVLKALEEDTDKKFTSGAMRARCDYVNCFVLKDGDKEFLINVARDWTEVKQPVTWQEALEAWAFNGKDISCEIGGCKYIYTRSNNIKDWLIDSADNGISNRRMTLGTWYIEN